MATGSSSRKEVKLMSVVELCSWLSDRLENDISQSCIDTVEKNRVNGKSFMELTDAEVKELFPLLGERKAMSRLLGNLKPQSQVSCLSSLRAHRDCVWVSTIATWG